MAPALIRSLANSGFFQSFRTTSMNPESVRFNTGNLPLVAFLEARKLVQGANERWLYRFKILESWFKH